MVGLRAFGPYEIVRQLGGGMGDVYLAFDTASKRPVVLKLIHHAGDPVTRLVLAAERRGAAIQQQLHAYDPRVVELYDFGDRDDCFYVAMQYLEGENAAEILRREGRLEPRRAASIALEVCSQLEKMHAFQASIDGRSEAAVVHGDIKPSNILIGPAGEVRLLDFGIAKTITLQHNLTVHEFGSPNYCSPERLDQARVDQHADLWAVGVTLYELVSGAPPYQAESTRKLENLIQSKRPPRALPASCPPGVKAIIAKALAGDAAQRYDSAAAFRDDLARFLEGRETAAELEKRSFWRVNPTVESAPAAPSAAPRPRRFRVRIRLTRVAAGLGCVLLGMAVFLATAYAWRYRHDRNQLRRAADLNLQWDLYRNLQKQYEFLGRLSPVNGLEAPVRLAFLSAADDVILGYRRSGDVSIQHFDWAKARTALERAVEMKPADPVARGKLALCRGYLALLQGAPRAAGQRFAEAGAALPASPDPHLALARLYAYSYRDVGRTVAELRQAARLGYKLGPREILQQGDVYRFRGLREVNPAPREARRDFQIARALYQRIPNYPGVEARLRQVRMEERAVTPRPSRSRRHGRWR